VVALERGAQVRSVLGVIGPAVDLEAGQFSRAQQGQFPSPPQALSAEARIDYERGLTLLGTGGGDGLEVRHPLVAGALLRDDDLPAGTAAQAAAAARLDLEPEAPGESLQDRLSPDLRVHTQPIPEFETVPPGEVPAGGVEVDF
jgi:hypothetical protein